MSTKTKRYLHLTKDIDSWDEPAEKLIRLKTKLEQYIGKPVYCWGGGGYSGSVVQLDKIELHPTILRDHEGFTLKVYLSKCEPRLANRGTDEFHPWLGSWQISVEE